ncbi:hypothetical protein QAD02_023457 [Eretmocerus hayati]|uniref:Uncharacterized protein n=1 Tax=Eretmocerus hayati TaxID=131215 RepID=A0ACC2PX14_9HYME|nr:hypothetical protein QAD02_023457 [Eretmocerus hayati]
MESKNYFEKGDFSDGLIRAHHKNLTETTATSILNFNGRRPTETGGVLTKDYEFAKTADPESEYFKMLSKAEQQQRLKYKRMDMAGKKGSEGHLFINKTNDECVKLILRHRMDVGINISNPYLFAIPTHPGQEEQFVNLSPVYAKLAAQCKIYHPEINDKAVRATKIRAHHATLNSAMENGTSVELMSKQLGHSTAMHESRYKKRIDKTDVLLTKHLETMMGEAEQEHQPLMDISETSEILPEDPNSIEMASAVVHVEVDVHGAPHTKTKALPRKETKSKPAIKSIKRVQVNLQRLEGASMEKSVKTTVEDTTIDEASKKTASNPYPSSFIAECESKSNSRSAKQSVKIEQLKEASIAYPIDDIASDEESSVSAALYPSSFVTQSRSKSVKHSGSSLGTKPRWTPEEIAAFEEAFSVQLREKRYASAAEMRQAKDDYPALQVKSEAQMRTRLFNEKKKRENSGF